MSGRERLLVGVLAFLVMPLAFWFLVAKPLLESRETTEARLAEARELLAWVEERDREWKAAAVVSGAAVARRPVGLSGIETALSESGLRTSVTTLENVGGGGIVLRLENVPFVLLGQFLERAETTLGYDIVALRVTRGAATGDVIGEIELAPDGT